MKRIALIDVDGHNFPNIALMKISSYHKNKGDVVEWANLANYDKTYMSKIFSFTPDFNYGLSNYGEIIKGGTGYNFKNLPKKIDSQIPDYSIYPGLTAAYGFLTRGCNNKCSYCIVPNKEGKIKPYADIEDFLSGRNKAVLLDNNVLQSKHGINQIIKIINLKIKIDFNQGLSAKIIADDKHLAKLLSKVKWIKYIRLACDHSNQIPIVEKAIENLLSFGIKKYRLFIYMLVKEIPDALLRANYFKEIDIDPFAQPFYDFKNNILPNSSQKKFTRWVNRKEIFNSIEFKDYK